MWITYQKAQGTIMEQMAPCSYEILTESGTGVHLEEYQPALVEEDGASQATRIDPVQDCTQHTRDVTVRTRSGRISAPPERMNPSWQV